MTSGTLIPMDRHQRLLNKACLYLENMDVFISEPETALTVLIDALPYADDTLILKMLPLLGLAGKDRVLWPLYQRMLAVSEDEALRTAVAVQLGLAASMSDDAAAIRSELIGKLSHPDPQVRSSCVLALGWEGNWPAVNALVAHLSDPDPDVRGMVVAALASVGDRRVFDLLVHRLYDGKLDEQRIILLHLWRFAKQVELVEKIYLTFLGKTNPDVCLDILSGLAMIPLSPAIIDRYRRLLAAEDPKIRLKVLDNLLSKKLKELPFLEDKLPMLLRDKDARVRQAAVRLFTRQKGPPHPPSNGIRHR